MSIPAGSPAGAVDLVEAGTSANGENRLAMID